MTWLMEYTSRRPSGGTVSLTIYSESGEVINGWTFPNPGQQVTNPWNGSYTQSGQSVEVGNASWKGYIGPNGGSVYFGFNMSWSGSNPVPTDFPLNGVACAVK